MDLSGASDLFLNRTEDFLSSSDGLRWLFAVLASLNERGKDSVDTERAILAVSKAVRVSPHSWTFAAEFLCSCVAAPPFGRLVREKEEGEEEEVPKKRRRKTVEKRDETELLGSCLTLVKTDPFFHGLWKWGELFKILSDNLTDDSLFLAAEVLGTVFGLSEEQRMDCISEFITGERYHEAACRHLKAEQNVSLLGGYSIFSSSSPSPIAPPSLPLVCEAGVVLPRKFSSTSSSSFVPVSSRLPHLRRLALCAASGHPVVLLGPSGCGKTALVQHLRDATGRTEFDDFHRVQICDETDSRTLLGGYTCAAEPGTFVWADGMLTKALKNGHWLLLEDADKASPDLLSLLTNFLNTRAVKVPALGRDSLHPAPGFQLFLTGDSSNQSRTSSLPFSEIHVLEMEPYSELDVVDIAIKRFSSMKDIVGRMSPLLRAFNKAAKSKGSQAPLGLNDLIRWCQRCQLFPKKYGDERRLCLFREAVAVFCLPLSDRSERIRRTEALAQVLQVDGETAHFYLNDRRAPVSVREDMVAIGDLTWRVASQGPGLDGFSDTYCLNRLTCNLLEFLVTSVSADQPVLLVGETGVGKTATVQYLSRLAGKRLHVINVSDSSESSDLFGAFRPVDVSVLCKSLVDGFVSLCSRASYSRNKNRRFVWHLKTESRSGRWAKVVELVLSAAERVVGEQATSEKDRKLWSKLKKRAEDVKRVMQRGVTSLFSFVNGALSNAVRDGDWVLLDEVNLAGAEPLLALGDLFNGTGCVRLPDGFGGLVRRHPDFRLFCCMNPSTDVGKRDLPPALAARLARCHVDEPEAEADLMDLVARYFSVLRRPRESDVDGSEEDAAAAAPISNERCYSIVRFYRLAREAARTKLCDGAGRKPCYSLRTLCRAMTIAASNYDGNNLDRVLLEGLSACFLTELDRASYDVILWLIFQTLGKKNALQSLRMPPHLKGSRAVQVEGYWIQCGEGSAQVQEGYILTETVRKNLRDVARVVSLSSLPVLLQGETSSGKTSLIRYLAEATGNKLVRINNHEHTDVQEYVGCYGSDSEGRFSFREGLLATAMRRGHWIILDELNLASTEILEALNRVLDDNRELFIPETETLIRAHPSFRVFATQNPVGFYGGRKVLSRAFRNRFVELHFDNLSPKELEEILHKKDQVPAKVSSKMIRTMTSLQLVRRSSATFDGKHGFITLRDLFRWAQRYSLAPSPDSGESFYDWDQHMAEEGYLVLATRCRDPGEEETVRQTLNREFGLKRRRRPVGPDLFSMEEPGLALRREMEAIREIASSGRCELAMTSQTVRTMALLLHCFRYQEPVLLVGETGVGKTSITKVISDHLGRRMLSLSCHLNTDASDFLGGLRPARATGADDDKKLFEWQDGPLVRSMLDGSCFLVDEISLADDSVLERINSALEPDRVIVVPERPAAVVEERNKQEEIVAHENFLLCATMNPSGDFGKKELSPALRNRFSEIWCPSHLDPRDSLLLLNHLLPSSSSTLLLSLPSALSRVSHWMNDELQAHGSRVTPRDLRTMAEFVGKAVEEGALEAPCAVVHAVSLVLCDGLPMLDSLGSDPDALRNLKHRCRDFLSSALNHTDCECLQWLVGEGKKTPTIRPAADRQLQIGPFLITTGEGEDGDMDVCEEEKISRQYCFSAPTVSLNALRVVRALWLSGAKPVLLEGPPGIGKSAVVQAMAELAAVGTESRARRKDRALVRINLSEQTDVADLFGSDLPEEGAAVGSFSWRDGPFLSAMKHGQWILLDELNLASQAVLEGLNACLDHRGEVYIPELDRTFRISSDTKIFATQNPHREGCGRKGLPKSFLNRFVKVFVAPLDGVDVVEICKHRFSSLSPSRIEKLVGVFSSLQSLLSSRSPSGGPWSLNLRDLMKWCGVLERIEEGNCVRLAQLLFVERFRTEEDREEMSMVLKEAFWGQERTSTDMKTKTKTTVGISISAGQLTVGKVVLKRQTKGPDAYTASPSLVLLPEQFPLLESLAFCVRENWIPILVGPAGSGKTRSLSVLAQMTKRRLHVLTLSSLSDTADLIGGFEQSNSIVKMLEVKSELLEIAEEQAVRGTWRGRHIEKTTELQQKFKDIARDQRVKEGKKCLKDFIEYLKTETEPDELTHSRLDSLASSVCSTSSKQGFTFEWVDSVLVRAAKRGEWVLLDHANRCAAAVLDRLNGLFEDGGVLAITEGGCSEQDCIVRPHKDFRIFLAMDPKNGELSDAMRNRCVEIFVCPENLSSASCRLLFSSSAWTNPGLNLQMETPVPTDLSSTAAFRKVFDSSLACGVPIMDTTKIARELVSWRRPQEGCCTAALPPLPSPSVSVISAHPSSATAIFQMDALRDLLRAVPPGFARRLIVISFLKFSDRETLPLRMHLLRKHFVGLEDFDGDEAEKLLTREGGLMMDSRFFHHREGHDYSDDNFRVIGLELEAARALVPLSSTGTTVELAEMLDMASESVMVLFAALSKWRRRNSCHIDDGTWLLLWQVLSASCFAHDSFQTDRTAGDMRTLLAVARRKVVRACRLVVAEEDGAAEVRVAAEELFKEIALDIRVHTEKSWRLEGGGGTRSVKSSKEERMRYKEILSFAEGCSPYSSVSGNFEDMRKRVFTHAAFMTSICNAPQPIPLLSTPNDLLSTSLEDALATTASLVHLAASGDDDDDCHLSDLLPLDTKLALHPATASKFSWTHLQKSNSVLLHHLLREDGGGDVVRLAAAALEEKLGGDDGEGSGSSLEKVADTVALVAETYWLLQQNWRPWKAGSLQRWRLLSEVALASFKCALKDLGFCGERGASLATFLRHLKQSLSADTTEKLSELLNECISGAEVNEIGGDPASAGRLVVDSSLALAEIASSLLSDRLATLETEAALLRTMAAEARLRMRADRCCLTLSCGGEESPDAVVGHHPLHARLSAFADESEEEADRLDASLPVRVEPWEQLESEVRGLLDGPMDGDVVRTLFGQLADASEEARVKFRTWKKSLANFVRDVQVKFSSYPDVVSPVCAAVLQAVTGMTIIAEHSGTKCVGAVRLQTLDGLQPLSDICCHRPGPVHCNLDMREENALLRLDVMTKISASFPRRERSDELLSGKAVSPRALMGRDDSASVEFTRLTLGATSGEDLMGFEPPRQECLLHSCKLALGRLLAANVAKGDLLALVTPTEAARATVTRLLEDHWPDNPVLLEISDRLRKLLSHSVWDSERSFHLALEDVLRKADEWNRQSPARYAIPLSGLKGTLESWKRRTIMQIKDVTADLEARTKARCVGLSTGVLQLCSKICSSPAPAHKGLWLAAVILCFEQSTEVLDRETRCASLAQLADIYHDVQGEVSKIFSIGKMLSEPFEEAVAEEVGKRRKACEKKLADGVKLMLVNREGDFVKIGRERGKKLQECTELFTQPMPPLDADKLGTPRAAQDESFHVADKGRRTKAEVLQFYGDDGTNLGGSWKMSEIARGMLKSVSKSLLQEGAGLESLAEEAEGVKSLLGGLRSTNKESKSEVYVARKAVESLMKELRESRGLFRPQGSLAGGVGGLVLVGEAGRIISSDVAECLLLLDEMTRSLRTNAGNLAPHFEERALGLARHAVLRMLEAQASMETFSRSTQVVHESLREMRSFCFDERVVSKVITICRRLDRLVGMVKGQRMVEKLRLLKNCLSEAVDSDGEDKEMGRKLVERLEACKLEVFHLCERYAELRERASPPAYREAAAILKDANGTLKMLSMTGAAEHSPWPPFERFLKSLLVRCLGSVKSVQKLVSQEDFGAEETPFSHPHLTKVFELMDVPERAAEVKFLTSSRRLSLNERQLLLEGEPILDVYGQLCTCVEKWARTALSSDTRYLGNVLRCLSFFATIPRVKENKDDDGRDGEEVDGDDLKPSSGVGLGEGEGEKATVDGVDSEDLFENVQEEQQGERQEKEEDRGGEDKNEDFVDYSDQLQEDRLTDQSENEGDDDEDKEDGDDKMSDVEGETDNKDEDQHKKDDLLNSEDWKQEKSDEEKEEEEESMDKKEESRQADFLTEEETMKDQQEVTNDMVDEPVDDKEKRERLPDTEETNDIEDQTDDGQYNNQEDPEVEDLDMDNDDQHLDDLDGGDSDQEKDMDVEDDIERLGDFKEEEPPPEEEDGDQMVEESAPRADGPELEEKLSGNDTKKPQMSQGAENNGGDEEGEDAESASQETTEKEAKKNKLEAQEKEATGDETTRLDQKQKPTTTEEDVETKHGEDEEKMESDLLAEEDLKIVPNKDLADAKESDVYAHENENREDEGRSALDDVQMEELEGFKRKVPDLPERRQKKNKDEGEEKKEVDQAVGTWKKARELGEETATNLVSRGDCNTVSEGMAAIDRGVGDLTVEEEAEEGGGRVAAASEDRHIREWSRLCAETTSLSRQLTERLRLVIEPTRAARFRGDFRTGKRLNMRRIVPYIASNFRRDKIWLRRTRPSKRECKILIALDDSSSMSDNKVQEMSFRALAVLSETFSVLEVGSLGVVRFGQQPEVVVPPRERIGPSEGAAVLANFTFSQPLTRFASLLRRCGAIFEQGPASASAALSDKLLVVLSDGRGVLNEGKRLVEDALRQVRLNGVFVVFFILEVAENNQSVLDVRMPIFDAKGNLVKLEPYMEHFPFPFYIILRDFEKLPQVLSDALRQWFELVNSDPH